MFYTYRPIHDLRGVQIKFILLNPRSHSAVLTGSVWIAPISLLIFLPETSAPFISLKSLYSCFKSLVYGEKKKLLHASLSSFSPYSDETVEGQEVGNKVLTVSLGLGTSGTCIGCTRTKSSHTGNAKSLFTPGSQGSFGRPSTTLGRTRARSNASVPLFIADAFLEAFTTKGRTTHEVTAGSPPPVFPPTTCGLSILSSVTEEELRRTIL